VPYTLGTARLTYGSKQERLFTFLKGGSTELEAEMNPESRQGRHKCRP
jgi:hypothetical protein